MGKTVAFWTKDSTYGSTAGVMAAMACSLGITDGMNVAVTALPGKSSDFIDLFNVRIPEKIRSGRDNTKGFYPMMQKALYEKPGEKMIQDAGIHTINKGPLLFPWFDADDSVLTEKNAVTLIMGGLKECFDFVLVDAGAGDKNEYSELFLKNADVVVVLMPQDKRKWKDYFDKERLTGTGRFIYVMCPYYQDSVYNAMWFSHHFGKDGLKVHGIPINALFLDACSEGRVAELFLEAGKNKKKSTAFFKAVYELTKGVKGK